MSAPLPALSRIAAGLAEIAAGLAALAAGETAEASPVPVQLVVGDTGAVEINKEETKPTRTRKAKAPEVALVVTERMEPEELKPELPEEVTPEALRALCRAAAAKLGVSAINAALGGISVADMTAEQRLAGKAGVEAAVAAKGGAK